MKKLVIIGAGGLGREVAAMVKACFSEEYLLKGFVDDGLESGRLINGLPVLGNKEWLNSQKEVLNLVLAIGNSAIRSDIYDAIEGAGHNFPNIIHPKVSLHESDEIKFGIGNVITDGCILTTNITIGNFNFINLSCTLGHDSTIANFCSIMPGVNVSGGATIEDRVYVGTGAKLIKATKLGRGCTVGAGAVVKTDVPKGETYVGVPAKPVRDV